MLAYLHPVGAPFYAIIAFYVTEQILKLVYKISKSDWPIMKRYVIAKLYYIGTHFLCQEYIVLYKHLKPLQVYEPVEEGSYIKMIDMVSGKGGQLKVCINSQVTHAEVNPKFCSH